MSTLAIIGLVILGIIIFIFLCWIGLIGFFFEILGAIFGGSSSGGSGFGGGDSGGGGSSDDW